MTIAGFVLIVIGLGIFGLVFTNNVPEFMDGLMALLDFPPWAWLAIAAVGAVLMYFNRRPAN